MASYIDRASRGARSRREAANRPHVAVERPSDRQHERRWHFCVACSVAAVGRGCNTTDRVEVITSFPIRGPSALGSV